MRNKEIPVLAQLAAIAACALTVAACGSLFNKSVKTVAMGSEPSEAEVYVDGNRMGVTPVTLELDNHESHTVVFRKEGYQEVTCELDASAGAGWIILDIVGGLLPVVVDAATGDWKGISEDTCNVNLPPAGDESAERPKASSPQDRLARMAEDNGWVMLQ